MRSRRDLRLRKNTTSKVDRRCIINGQVQNYYCAAQVKTDPYSEPHTKDIFFCLGTGYIHSIGSVKFKGKNKLTFYTLNHNRKL